MSFFSTTTSVLGFHEPTQAEKESGAYYYDDYSKSWIKRPDGMMVTTFEIKPSTVSIVEPTISPIPVTVDYEDGLEEEQDVPVKIIKKNNLLLYSGIGAIILLTFTVVILKK